MNFVHFKEAIKDWRNQIIGDTVLSWCNRIIIAVFFFSISLGLAGYLLFCTQLKEYAILIVAAFTFINGIGIFIINTADRKKEFNDKKQDFKDVLFSQRNSRLLDAIKLISQENEKLEELNQSVIRFAFSELIELSQFPDFKERIDLFTSRNNFRKFYLSGLDLSRFDFNETQLHGAHLRDTKLIKAKLNYANLVYADLSGADLSGTDLSGTDLRDTDLTGAIWDGANLEDAIRCDADLEKLKK